MNASRGRPTKDSIKKGRGQPIAESVGRSLQERMPPPNRPFSEDIVEDTMRAHVDGPCELGDYVEAEDRSAPGRLHGRPQAIAFDGPWWDWFRKLSPELRAVVLWFAGEFRDEDRQAALVEMVDERVERAVVRRFFRRLKHAFIAAVLASFALAHWFSDQVAWFMGKLPILREFWNLIAGAAKP